MIYKSSNASPNGLRNPTEQDQKNNNSKFNVQIFITRKAFAIGQEIRDFKKLLFKSKRIQKNHRIRESM